MYQATRSRFTGGDPLALTKRIHARRQLAHSLLSEVLPPREPIEPTITGWRDVWSILWQATFIGILFVAIAWTLSIFAVAMGW